MHVLILGAGALGSLLGARLARTGVRLSLFTRNTEHLWAIRDYGLRVEERDGLEHSVEIAVFGRSRDIPQPADLVLVAVKSPDTREAVRGILDLTHRQTVFLTLQNGIGNVETIMDAAGEGRVLAGTTSQGATLTAPGRVRHGGDGATLVGEPDGPPTERAGAAAALFRSAGLEAQAAGHMREHLWEKLLVNAAINPTTALAGVSNGWIAEPGPGRKIAVEVLREALTVAEAIGIRVREDAEQHVFDVARATASNRSSMLQDLEHGKPTEIEAITGAVVRLGVEHGVEVPVNRTLLNLVKLIEARNA